jgi:hypothetical protein
MKQESIVVRKLQGSKALLYDLRQASIVFIVAAYECAIYTDPAMGPSYSGQKDAERLGGTYVSYALA